MARGPGNYITTPGVPAQRSLDREGADRGRDEAGEAPRQIGAVLRHEVRRGLVDAAAEGQARRRRAASALRGRRGREVGPRRAAADPEEPRRHVAVEEEAPIEVFPNRSSKISASDLT